MKNRVLRHDLLRHPRFLELTHEARLLYLALLCHVDDYGICKTDDFAIVLACAPTSDHRWIISRVLPRLVESGFVHRSDNGKWYALRGFRTDQTVSKVTSAHFKDGLPDELREIVEANIDDLEYLPADGMVTWGPAFDAGQEVDARTNLLQAENLDNHEWTKTKAQFDAGPEIDLTPPPITPPTEASPEVWRLRVQKFQEGRPWFSHYGPKPGEPGCQVPMTILMEAGIDLV